MLTSTSTYPLLTKIAIYTITNSRLARTLYSLWTEGVDIKIITDDETMGGKGCDIQNLANAGIPVRNDVNLQARMHHKFIVIDDELLMNGSFNWTVAAVKNNNENVVVTSDALQIQSFKAVTLVHQEFLKMWDQYEHGQLKSNGQVDPDLVEYQKRQQANSNYNNYKQQKKVAYGAKKDYADDHYYD